MEYKNLSADSPILSKESDRFCRAKFAERIAQVITKRTDPSCITIGLYGAWGDGKTSVLNFIDEYMDGEDQVISIRFNPWRFTTEDALLIGFFNDLAQALDSNLKTSGDVFKGLVKSIAPTLGQLSGSKAAGEAIASLMSGPDLDEFKKRIEKELEAAKKRVLVVIDDVDRLENREIHLLFKLVKLTADFRYTAYVLAFDKGIVAASLSNRYSSGDENAGEAFLEKIIQVPLNLPAISSDKLRAFCLEGVQEAIDIAEIELSDQQVQEFIKAFTYAFDEIVETPRKAKLYSNTLLFSLPILKGEVNPVDQMLIEGIRVFYPNLYHVISKNESLFVGSFDIGPYTNSDAEKEKIKSTVAAALEKDKFFDDYGITEVLQSLFPKLQAVYGNTHYRAEEWNQKWSASQRICSTHYFKRFFSYTVDENDFSDLEITELVEGLDKYSYDQIDSNKTSLGKLITLNNFEQLTQRLFIRFDSLTPYQAKILAITLCIESEKIVVNYNPNSFITPVGRVAMYVNDFIGKQAEPERVLLTCECIKKSTSINFSREIFRWLRKVEEGRNNEFAFTQEDVVVIGKCFAEEIKLYINSIEDITKSENHSISGLFYYLSTYGDKSVIKNHVVEIGRNDPNVVKRLIVAFTPIETIVNSGISYRSNLERSRYEDLVDYIPAELLMTLLESYDVEVDITADYPKKDSNEDDNIQLKQFIWLYHNPL